MNEEIRYAQKYMTRYLQKQSIFKMNKETILHKTLNVMEPETPTPITQIRNKV